MKLADIQTSFQEGILDTAGAVPGSVKPSQRQSAAERFSIYQEAYRLRLTEFLASDYPALHNVLGDDDFNALAQAYIAATQSPHRNARWYARDLPNFMRGHEPWQQIGAVIDLAVFERALSDAFDAADVTIIDAPSLAAIPAESQPDVRLVFQPGLSLLTLRRGTIEAFEAIAQGDDVPVPHEAEEEVVLVWRDRSLQAFYRVLGEDEAMALDAAHLGASFAEICSFLALRLPEEEAANQAAMFLVHWFGDGLVAGLDSQQQTLK